MPASPSSPAASAAPAATVVESLLKQRHSCRGFLPTPLPRATIEQIAAMAQATASWCNAQPWKLTLLSGKARDQLSAALVDAAQAGRPSAPDFDWPAGYPGELGERRRACGFALYDSVGIARGDRSASARQALENFRFFGAPHVAVITSPVELGTYGAVDCGGYVATFMLAAQSLGVASIAQAAIASWSDVVRRTLDLPAERRVVCAISFGLEDAAHPANGFRTARADASEVIDWRD